MKRALCIWLPNWPLQRLAAARAELSEQAVVLYELHLSGGAKVAAYCPQLATAAAALWEQDLPGATACLSSSANSGAGCHAHAGVSMPENSDVTNRVKSTGGQATRGTRAIDDGQATGDIRAAGIRAGMPLAEATALALLPLPSRERAGVRGGIKERDIKERGIKEKESSTLHLEMTDPAADRLAIDELAEWCHRFSPTVGLEEAAAPESLLLDVTGLERLFGGERALARQIVRAFRKRGLTARVAIADTLGAAWAVAHFADLEIPCATAGPSSSAILSALGVPLVIPPGEARAALAPLPPAALRLPAETCALLADLGVRRMDRLAALPRETLLARFGPLVLKRLDQATGAAAEAIVARAALPEWLFERLFEHPTGRREMIEWAVGQLVARACEALARERRGMLRLECRFEFERRPPERFVVGLYRASASERHVGDLVRLKLERLRFREPLVAIRLRVLAIDRLEFRQRELFAGERSRESPRELAALVDRLSNRLGPHAVVRPWLLASAQPEFACQYQPVSSLAERRLLPLPRRERVGVRGGKASGRSRKQRTSRKGQSDAGLRDSINPLTPDPSPAKGEGRKGDRPLHLELEPRPLVVLSVVPDGPPVKFRLAGRDQRIARTWGPERIETGWWRGGCVRRDYYQVETTRGERYWLFRELDTGRWFLHGMFA